MSVCAWQPCPVADELAHVPVEALDDGRPLLLVAAGGETGGAAPASHPYLSIFGSTNLEYLVLVSSSRCAAGT